MLWVRASEPSISPYTSAPLHPRTSAPLQEYRDFMSKSSGQKVGELNGTSELRAGHPDSRLAC